jgi:hypothetical protein
MQNETNKLDRRAAITLLLALAPASIKAETQHKEVVLYVDGLTLEVHSGKGILNITGDDIWRALQPK